MVLENFWKRLNDPRGKNFWEISHARGTNPNLAPGPALDEQILEFMKDAKEIKMNLDDVVTGPLGKESLEDVLKLGKAGSTAHRYNITKWEFYQVYQKFRGKTKFYYRGKDVTKKVNIHLY